MHVLYRCDFENGKSYVGQTDNLPKRIRAHKYRTVKRPFANALRRWPDTKFNVFAEVETKAEADTIEILEISIGRLNMRRWKDQAKGYNMTDGGEGTQGHKHSDETLAKLRDDNIKTVDILNLRKQGKTYKEIAEELNCAQSCVWKRLMEIGEDIKHGSRKVSTDKMVELSDKGYSHEKIGELLGVARPTVSWRLRNAAR